MLPFGVLSLFTGYMQFLVLVIFHTFNYIHFQSKKTFVHLWSVKAFSTLYTYFDIWNLVSIKKFVVDLKDRIGNFKIYESIKVVTWNNWSLTNGFVSKPKIVLSSKSAEKRIQLADRNHFFKWVQKKYYWNRVMYIIGRSFNFFFKQKSKMLWFYHR